MFIKGFFVIFESNWQFIHTSPDGMAGPGDFFYFTLTFDLVILISYLFDHISGQVARGLSGKVCFFFPDPVF